MVLSAEYEVDRKLRAEAFYSAKGTGCPVPRLANLILPGSGHGVLPGTRANEYADQVKDMVANYPGYEVSWRPRASDPSDCSSISKMAPCFFL